jgi:hypothetical protein
METFEQCRYVSSLLDNNDPQSARNELIKLLDHHEQNNLPYTPILNHLIRQTGLYPYLDVDSSLWQDKLIFELFKVDTGDTEQKTLHIQQASLLKKLLAGENIAVSAPTSFGKSFVIDAFISLKKPSTVVIIVPTLALTDETRRRLQKKFANRYKIITTPDVELGPKNIFIFPQERAINYIQKLDHIDILIIDEFYKASITYDKDRAPILLKAILELGKIADQKYFLAPNISTLKDSPFTEGMEFIPLDFNTVFTEKYEYYKEIEKPDDDFKKGHLLKILATKKTKTLIYAGTFTNIDFIANTLNEINPDLSNSLLDDFSNWLKINYHPEYILVKLVKKGIGIHNGQLHRSLSQIQVRLFEEPEGLENIISTSSIIEGVNTSAENVIIWANKNGKPRLNDFTYRNIVGRGGRMFRHFIGKVYLLEEPPKPEATQLSLEFTDDLLNSLDEVKHKNELTRDQIIKIIAFKEEMNSILGDQVYAEMLAANIFQSFNSEKLKEIARDLYTNPQSWSGLAYLNSNNPNDWDSNLFKALNFMGNVGASFTDMVAFIKAISHNWNRPIVQIIGNLRSNGVTIEKFFELERAASFRVATILSDINHLQKRILKNPQIDITPFISRLSNAFLPHVVFQLEEYGLPRMISKKIQLSQLIDFEDSSLNVHTAISIFNEIGREKLKASVGDLNNFDEYILDYFYDGITSIQ